MPLERLWHVLSRKIIKTRDCNDHGFFLGGLILGELEAQSTTKE